MPSSPDTASRSAVAAADQEQTRRVPILGRISMDLTLLDVTDLPEDAVQPGDRAEFFGPNVALDEVAAAAGTIGYELLTGLGSRVNRNWMELIWQKNA